jgi:hypothetical protein
MWSRLSIELNFRVGLRRPILGLVAGLVVDVDLVVLVVVIVFVVVQTISFLRTLLLLPELCLVKMSRSLPF